LSEPNATFPATKKGADKPATDWVAEVKSFAWLILAVLAVWSFVAKPFYIPSESMMPTLIKGDRLVVTKYPYGYSYVSPAPFHLVPFLHGRLFGRMPQRGDVVILKPPAEDSDYIKRVIALPGDRIEVREGVIILNGVPVPRVPLSPARIPVDANVPCDSMAEAQFRKTEADGKDYCELPRFRETLPNGVSYDVLDFGPYAYRPDPNFDPDNTPVYIVPEGQFFAMGDNRDNSMDSRFPAMPGGGIGIVPQENLVGKAQVMMFSTNGTASWLKPWTWFTATRWNRIGGTF